MARVQIWVPDVRSPEFAAETDRQAVLVSQAEQSADDMDFVEAISDDWAEWGAATADHYRAHISKYLHYNRFRTAKCTGSVRQRSLIVSLSNIERMNNPSLEGSP